MTTNSRTIDSVATLKKEQFYVRERLKKRETELRRKVQEIPGELAAAGANSMIPDVLKGKVTNAALQGGKSLIHKLFVKNDQPGSGGLMNTSLKTKGIVAGAKALFKLFKGK